MPNIKSAEKRQRQAIASTLQNKSKKTRIATAKGADRLQHLLLNIG